MAEKQQYCLDAEKWYFHNKKEDDREKKQVTDAQRAFRPKDVTVEYDGQKMVLRNKSDKEAVLIYDTDLSVEDKVYKTVQISFKGKNLENSGAGLYVNGHPVTLNSVANMEITPPINLHFTLSLPADSSVQVDEIQITTSEENVDLLDTCDTESDVLVITPDYPTSENMYLCAFVHSRVREYVAEGMHVQVARITPNTWYQYTYEMDGVPVLSGRYIDLKKLLSRKQYKAIVVHFVDERLYPILDGYVQDERLIFICHGPETTFRMLTNRCRPYFTKALPEIDNSTAFDKKEAYARKFAQRENVTWCFVSNWLREASEQLLDVKFKHSRVISNIINENLFPYHEKTAEDRKKIMVLRKFDNIRVHSIDQTVRAILSLSRRSFFNDLTFEVYGDGNYYNVLTEPLRQFSNVHLHKTFIPNDQIYKLHARNGILLIPSRHDTQGVAMLEAASSGVVPIGSELPVTSDFMNQAENHTLADPENPDEMADIVERLYYNPDEFLALSKRLSEQVQKRCNRDNTVMKEIALIREQIEIFDHTEYHVDVQPVQQPVLTITVPSYNVEQYLDKTIRSMLRCRNLNKMDIIIVNDGSKDRTLEIAKRYEALCNGVVRVIDKENGGHGSTINAGIAAARGKYFRLIDGDDWVDADNLDALVDKLENETVDVVLTKGCYEYIEEPELVNIISYDMLEEGAVYHFEDLLYPGYGFDGYGPILISGNYRTEVLQKAGFKISEKCPYVDMEFNSFALRYVDTLKYYDLDIYRYLIGREGQTVSRDFWKKKYKNHEHVILNILKTINEMPDYSDAKKKYVYEHITAMMIDSQIFMFDQLCLWTEIDKFLDTLKQWPEAQKAGLAYIKKKDGDCKTILREYKDRIQNPTEEPTPIIGGVQTVKKPHKSLFWYAKKCIRAVLPYGIVRIIQKIRYR